MLTVTHQGAALEAKSDVYNYPFYCKLSRNTSLCRSRKNVLSTGLLVLSAYDVRPSVSFRRSVPAWARSSKPAATQVWCCVPGWQEIDRLLHGRRSAAAGERGQCHVVSVRRKLNTELFILL